MGNSTGVKVSEILLSTFLDVVTSIIILLFCLLVTKFSKIISIIFITIISLFHIANMEYIYAMNNVLSIMDLSYVGDKNFLAGTLSHLSFPIYTVIIILNGVAIVLSIQFIQVKRILEKKALIRTITFFVIMCGGLIIFTPNNSDWKHSNFLYLSISNSFNNFIKQATGDQDIDPEESEKIRKQIKVNSSVTQGIPLLELGSVTGKKRNVLMVVLEGIPGVYLEKVQEFSGVQSQYNLKSLNKIAEHSIVLPNYVSHNVQTIRGLYSLLSNDYPKLSTTTPKAYEYMQLADNKPLLLPQLLANKGYNTAFIQAAPLEFMSKDQFMESAGFQKVYGQESFEYHYIPFGWGIDDKAFFEQSQKFIKELDEKDEPWFIQMLTVGTHHPYAISEEIGNLYPDRKEASIVELDNALTSFLQFIQESNIDKDTLILFVSDESHGVDNQPYGGNWGFALAYLPEIQNTIINDSVFGQIDILPSVIDYIDPESSNEVNGRSIFRQYTTERPILFANHYNGDVYFTNSKGKISQLNNKGKLYSIESTNGEMFSSEYRINELKDEKFKKLLRKYQRVADNSLFKEGGEEGQYRIIEQKTFPLKKNEANIITNGQFLNIPQDSIVSFEFNYDVKNPEHIKTLKFFLEKTNDNSMITKVTNDFTGKLYYRFYTKEELHNFSFALRVIPYSSGDLSPEVNITNLIISYTKPIDRQYNTDTNFNEYSRASGENKSQLPFVFHNNTNIYPSINNHLNISSKDHGILIYGPYAEYQSGAYTLKYHFKPNKSYEPDSPLFVLEVTSKTGSKMIAQKPFTFNELIPSGEEYIAELPFEIIEPKEEGIEFRLKALGDVEGIITDIRTEATTKATEVQ